MRSPIDEDEEMKEEEHEADMIVAFESIRSIKHSQGSISTSTSYGSLIAVRSSWDIDCDAAICEALLRGVPMSQAGDIYSRMLREGPQRQAPERVVRAGPVLATVEELFITESVSTLPIKQTVKPNMIKCLFKKLGSLVGSKRVAANKFEVNQIERNPTITASGSANIFKSTGATIAEEKAEASEKNVAPSFQWENEWEAMIRAVDAAPDEASHPQRIR
jgi:hypothetical protein